MKRPRLLDFALVVTATSVLISAAAAQTGAAQPTAPYPVKAVPGDSSIPYPARILPRARRFEGSNLPAADAHLIEYRSEAEMSEADRALAAKMLPAIGNAAGRAGIEFAAAQWKYQQLECQAIPHHLLLLFADNGGVGKGSLFSVSIPRAGSGGHVRVIPVERRGFTLFSPAPVNALAIAAFNRIRAEEPKSPPADWLATSLCYAALTEPRLRITLSPRQAPDENLALSFPPSLEVGPQGESTVRFVDVVALQQPMQWALTYDARNELLKVEHFPTPVFATRIIPKN